MSALQILNNLIPKKNIVVFSSFPGFSDNSRALFEYISKYRKDLMRRYDFIWLEPDYSNKREIENLGGQVRIKRSARGIWCSLRAKYIIHTHGFWGERVNRSARNQQIVNLWHGCGYKDIPLRERCYLGDVNFVTGKPYVPIHSDVFNIPTDKVHPTGLPRNDKLFEQKNVFEKLLIDCNQYERILIWMPTYRKAAFGHGGIDGLETSFGIGSLTAEDYRRLDITLASKNILLLIKPHPMDSIGVIDMDDVNNIKVITNEDLEREFIELYHLLSLADGLLSDYSSVIIDYLLVNKPIALVLSDMDEFAQSRGFVFSPVADFFPGPIISCFDEMLEYLTNLEFIDAQWEEKRAELTSFFHENVDGNSSEKVCNILFGDTREFDGESK